MPQKDTLAVPGLCFTVFWLRNIFFFEFASFESKLSTNCRCILIITIVSELIVYDTIKNYDKASNIVVTVGVVKKTKRPDTENVIIGPLSVSILREIIERM